MKFKKIILAVMAIVLTVGMGNLVAATNDVSATLQKGLFEEEANRNLDAAIQAYQAVVATTDKDRQYGATAIFRLGECYRKQGKTNEAAIQYQRIVREFPEQTELVAASKLQLPVIGKAPGQNAASFETRLQNLVSKAGHSAPDQTRDDLGNELPIDEIKKLSPETRRVVVDQQYPNPVLDGLMTKMMGLEETVAGLKGNFGETHPDVTSKEAELKAVYQQIDAQVDAALATHAAKATFPGTNSNFPAGFGSFNPEESEVKRIQAMIKDSPDLINAPDATGKTPLWHAADFNELLVAKYLLENGADTEARPDAGNATPLFLAVAGGHKEMVDLLLTHGANIEAAVTRYGDGHFNAHGAKPLHIAVGGGYKEIAVALLAHGAKVDATDDGGKTPLHVAAEKGFKSLAELLLQHSANINAQTDHGTTVLDAAVGAGNKAIVELLLTNRAEINAVRADGGTALYIAAEKGNLPIAEILIAQKADVNLSLTNGMTPLMVAVQQNHPDMVDVLLAHGADIKLKMRAKTPDASLGRNPTRIIGSMDQGDHDNWTALHFAVEGNRADLVEKLLAKGAEIEAEGEFYVALDPNQTYSAKTPREYTPLMMAVYDGRKELMKILLAHQASVNFHDSVNQSPLLIALQHRSPELVALLLENKAKANEVGNDGWTLLDGATTYGQKEIVELLLAHGADPNVPVTAASQEHNNSENLTGFTSLHFAARWGNLDIATQLLAHRADINAVTAEGWTPLHLAIMFRAPDVVTLHVVTLLVEHGADVNLVDKNGRASLDLAGDEKNEIADLLRQHGAVSAIERGTIRITRNGQTAHGIVFSRDAGSNNYHTLYEVLAYTYPHPLGFTYISELVHKERQPELPGFYFPDFAHVKIRQRNASGKTNTVNVDLATALTNGDCSQNLPLNWGDVVELPELDHNVSENWSGLSLPVQTTLKKCLERHVDIVVKGKVTKVALGLNPADVRNKTRMDQVEAQQKEQAAAYEARVKQITADNDARMKKATNRPASDGTSNNETYQLSVVFPNSFTADVTPEDQSLPVFWLSDVVRGSKVLLASSDTTRIKVKRAHPAAGKPVEQLFNLDKINTRSDLWLEDGDVIEIPEK